MAGDERAGRLRLGDNNGRDHPALPRRPDRCPAGSVGPIVVLNDLEVDIERADGSVVNLRENGRFLDFHAAHGPAELAIRNRRHFDRAIDRSGRRVKTSCIRRFARSATVSEPACG
jgi:hypothetical protein